MSEADVVSSCRPGDGPVTRSRLEQDLRALGLSGGATVLVHSSLSKLGWVAGGPQAVVEVLLATLGPEGTLVVPAHSSALSDPANWRAPPVPESWWETIRAETPAFDPALTPTRKMGVIVETFLRHPGVLRSAHPQFSFAAAGPQAAEVVASHPIDCRLGEDSPLGALYRLDAQVLLLGVDHSNNTSLHLAEYRADFPSKTTIEDGAPALVDGARRWVSFTDLKTDSDDFAKLGRDFARDTRDEIAGPVGWGEARLFRVRSIVDYGARWLEENRSA